MNDNTMMAAGIAAVTVVVTVVLGLIFGFSGWLAVPVLVGLAVVAVVVLVSRPGGDEPDLWSSGRGLPPAEPVAAQSAPTGEIRVPSDTDDYPYLFSATVSWLPGPGSGTPRHHDHAAVASQAVIDRAIAVSRSIPPADAGAARIRLGTALGAEQPDVDGHVRAWATDVAVSVPKADAERIQTLADLRKSVEVWEHQRAHERDARAYLGGDALQTTGSALVWWLVRHADDVEGAVERIEHLHRLSAVAQGRTDLGSAADPPLAPTRKETSEGVEDDLDTATRLVNQIYPDPDDPLRNIFVLDFVRAAEKTGLCDFGERLRDRFGLQKLDEDFSSGDHDEE